MCFVLFKFHLDLCGLTVDKAKARCRAETISKGQNKNIKLDLFGLTADKAEAK